jgi:hypothetical protein
VKNNIFSRFAAPEELKEIFTDILLPEFHEANGHIHTPYSFSAFHDLKSVFSLAKCENISLLGINDFYVTDGYDAFYDGCLSNRIFPLYNIEFIGLMKEEQKKGIRINDPNNPGRIYFCGKGLDYPFHLEKKKSQELKMVKLETQSQLCSMVLKLNRLISAIEPDLKLNFEEIKKRFAKELVRERHIAKALRILVAENFKTPEEQIHFFESLYGGKKSKAGISDTAALENEIRSNLLKAGGAAFVEEDERSFFDLKKIIEIIIDAGGIPCYPVLLDDPSGKCTEFEEDPERLYTSLSELGVGCIELIPGRNDFSILKNFVEFFDKKGFIIIFGTEHNTPDMIPLTVTARGKKPLDESLKKIAWRGASVIAAHQYLHAKEKPGYIDSNGKAKTEEKRNFELLGKMVIEYYLNNKYDETGNF